MEENVGSIGKYQMQVVPSEDEQLLYILNTATGEVNLCMFDRSPRVGQEPVRTTVYRAVTAWSEVRLTTR